AAAPEACPERVVGLREASRHRAGRLVKDTKARVDDLHILGGTDRAVGIGRRAGTEVSRITRTAAQPAEAEPRGSCERRAGCGLQGAIGLIWASREGGAAQRAIGRTPERRRLRREVAQGGRDVVMDRGGGFRGMARRWLSWRVRHSASGADRYG